MHCVTEMIEESESAMQHPLACEKKLNYKYVEVGGNIVSQLRNGSWSWLAFACARYTAEQREVAKAFADEE